MGRAAGSRNIAISAPQSMYLEAGAAGFTTNTGTAMVTSRNDSITEPQTSLSTGVFILTPREGCLLALSMAVKCDATDNNSRVQTFSVRRWHRLFDGLNAPDQERPGTYQWTCRELLQSAEATLNPSTAPTALLTQDSKPTGAWRATTVGTSSIKWAAIALGSGVDLGLDPNGVRFNAGLIGEVIIDPLGAELIEVHIQKTNNAAIVGVMPVATWITG